jgi:hypothetical protein
MSKTQSLVSRSSTIAVAVVLSVATVLPTLIVGRAGASQATARSIQISSSTTGATGVEYTIRFNLATASTNLEGLVIDTCSGNTSPLIGMPCSLPTSFSWGTPTVVSATVGGDNIAGWSWSTTNGGRTLRASDATGVATAVNDVATIVLSGVSNPSDVDPVTGGNQVGTYYGRILTFNDSTEVANYLPTNGTSVAGVVDFGGTALSTTNDLTVTARVQEFIRFCVYTNGFETSGTERTCVDGTGSAIDIPDATTPLSTNAVLTEDAFMNIASNAVSGVSVRMWSNNGSDGVLKSGTYTISAFGPTVDDVCTADSASTATEQFGMRIIGGTGVTAVAPYNCAASNHGWDTDSVAGAGANDASTVGSTYGDTIVTTAGATDADETRLEFAAKSALTTEAGIYTTVLNYIATGTY